MVIQLWQTVWLLMAAILAAVFCFVPMASIADDMSPESATFLRPADIPVLFVVDGEVALLLFIAIFLYKNTARQRTVTLVSMLLIVVVMVTEVCYLLSWGAGAGARVEWLGSIFLLLGALVSAVLAYRGIRHDERLLRAADRLR